MLRRRLDKILSVFLALLLIFCSTCYADNVFVAGAPTSTTGTVNATGNVNIGTGTTGVGDRLYPGSLAKSSDSPTSANSITPATNKSSTIASSNGKSSSNIISNGYTWEKSNTENQAPVSQDSISPGDKKIKSNNSGSRNSVSANGPGGSTTSNNSTNGGTYYTSDAEQQTGNVPSLRVTEYADGGFNLKKAGLPDPIISSDGAILANISTGEIYYAKNLTKTYAPAGLNALITGYILLKSRQLTDVLTVSQTAVSNIESGATTVGLKAGDTITVQDALYALYIRSACDVANVIAENVAGSQQAFVTLMNQTAIAFGTKSTAFLNPTGLNATGQVSSVYDMALIMSNIAKEPVLNLAMQTPVYTLPATAHRGAIKITAKNEFINPAKKNYYPGVVSSRMGYTSKARYSMASLVIHNGQYLISVVMYSNNTQYVDSKRLMNFGKTAVDKLLFNIDNVLQANAIDKQENQGTMTASQVNESLLDTSQPTSNQETTKGKSNIISNGYTWTSSNTENQEPVAQTLSSPGGSGGGGKGVTVKTNNNVRPPVVESSDNIENNTFYSSAYVSNAAQTSSETNATNTTSANSQSGSNIISNGYTWESSSTENQAPVTQTLNSPVGESVSATQSSDATTAQPSPSTNANMAALGNVINNLTASTQSSETGADTSGSWQQDANGWTFMKSNGQRAVNEWVITGGKRYCMDANGYMITGWREFSNGAIYYFNPANGEMRYNTWVNTSTGAYYLQADGTLARADKGQTKTIATQVGNYIIDENGKAIQRVQ